MNIEDDQELDCEQQFKEDQGVDIEAEKKSIRQQGHNHGKKKRHGPKQGQNWGILGFTMFMPIQAYILQYFWLWENLTDDDGSYGFKYYGNLCLMIFVAFMNFQTYYYCIYTKNTPYDKPIPAGDKNVEEYYSNNKDCKVCQKWKPIRTSHCSTCGTCTMKLDHHCPWIDNCVGLKNHKAFLLFTFYMAVGAIQYDYHSFSYFSFLKDQKNFFAYNHILFYVYWTIVNFIIIPMSLMLTGLVCFHSYSLMSNMTTLQNLAGAPSSLPCAVDQDPKKLKNAKFEYINNFDQGICKNIYDFFMGERFSFWIGSANHTQNDGSYYDMNPVVEKTQMMRFQLGKDFPKEFDAKVFETDVLEKFDFEMAKESRKFMDKRFSFKTRLFQFPSQQQFDNLEQKRMMMTHLQNSMQQQQAQQYEQILQMQKSGKTAEELAQYIHEMEQSIQRGFQEQLKRQELLNQDSQQNEDKDQNNNKLVTKKDEDLEEEQQEDDKQQEKNQEKEVKQDNQETDLLNDDDIQL